MSQNEPNSIEDLKVMVFVDADVVRLLVGEDKANETFRLVVSDRSLSTDARNRKLNALLYVECQERIEELARALPLDKEQR